MEQTFFDFVKTHITVYGFGLGRSGIREGRERETDRESHSIMLTSSILIEVENPRFT